VIIPMSLAVALLGPSMQQPISASRWKCTAQKFVECIVAGCEERKPSAWIILDDDRQTYSRCDSDRCDQYPADVHESDMFRIYELRGRATFLKRSELFGQFIDVATSGVAAFVNSGTCEPHK
jgi:hypothetical protein